MIISDYTLPRFNGLEALKIRNDIVPTVPFILVTGSINEEVAVSCMKAGADDYIIKENLSRLGSAIKSAIKNKDLVKAKLEVEHELIRTQMMFNAFLEYSPVYFFFKDSEARAIKLSNNYEEMLGRPVNELIGKTMDDLFPSELAKSMIEDDIKIINNNVPVKVVEELNGRVFETMKFPIIVEGQRPFLAGFTVDITDRKKAAELISSERMLLRTLIDNIPDMIYVKDTSCRKIISNKADVDNIGCETEADVLGKTDIELFPGEIGERGYADDLSIIKNGKKVINVEEDFVDVNRKRRWLLTTKLPLCDDNGNITGLVGIGRDITHSKEAAVELIKAKEKAEESDRLKTAFLHNISHEIRTPMNAIIGFSALLGEKDIDKETQNTYIDVITQSSNQLLGIVSDIIEISNIEVGILKANPTLVNLNSLLNGLYNQFIPSACAKGIHLKFETPLSESESNIKTDGTKLIQIFSNLINNALKFTSSGSVDFGYVLKKDVIEFHVSDTGIGIAEDQYLKIFDRFYQVEHSASRQYEGTGLGLSISKAYVELLGGNIWPKSGIGRGTDFYFTVPNITEGEVVNSRKTNTVQDKPDRAGTKTILIAEDEINNSRLLTVLLGKSGLNLNVLHANNGKEAVEIYESGQKIDLVIMDIKMPVMDGLEATGIIKKMAPDLPIIALTAFAFESDKEKVLKAGCDDYLSKPVNKEVLYTMIKKYI
jgi:PAS domain S-box-containing protein